MIGLLLPLLMGQASLDPPSIAPADFSGASGFYAIESHALPTDIEINKPLILIVTITGDGPEKYWPMRDKLKIFTDDAKSDFYISDFASRDRHYPAQRKWTFHYRLKPKRLDITVIPALSFRFWYPRQQKFILRKSEPIAITVKPAPAVKSPEDAVQQVHIPKHLLELAPQATSLVRSEPPAFPGWWLVFLVLASAPTASFLWLWAWRRYRPDAARRMRRSKNRAARHALYRLRSAGDVGNIVSELTNYLRRRIDIVSQETTADEVAQRLRRLGTNSDLRTRFIAFYATCDAVRFGGRNDERSRDLRNDAAELIQDLEADIEAQSQGLHSLGVALTVFLSVAAAQAASDADLFQQAQNEFHLGRQNQKDPKAARRHFAKAAGVFERLTERGIRNAAHFRNQGNAELLGERLPQAILSYRRGLRIAPNDADLQHALDYARRQVDYSVAVNGRPPNVGWPTWLPYPQSQWLFPAAVLFYVAAWICWTRQRMVDRPIWLTASLLAAVLCAAASAGVWWSLKSEQRYIENPIVVVSRDTPLFTGNSDKYPTSDELPDLKRGMEARLIHRRGYWVQLEFANGEIGWTHRDAMLIDRP